MLDLDKIMAAAHPDVRRRLQREVKTPVGLVLTGTLFLQKHIVVGQASVDRIMSLLESGEPKL